MLQTVEAIIDEKGNVRLLEAVRLERPRRALVTILSIETKVDNGSQEESIVGSLHIVDDDLEAGSAEIRKMFHDAIEKSARDLDL